MIDKYALLEILKRCSSKWEEEIRDAAFVNFKADRWEDWRSHVARQFAVNWAMLDPYDRMLLFIQGSAVAGYMTDQRSNFQPRGVIYGPDGRLVDRGSAEVG